MNADRIAMEWRADYRQPSMPKSDDFHVSVSLLHWLLSQPLCRQAWPGSLGPRVESRLPKKSPGMLPGLRDHAGTAGRVRRSGGHG